MKFQQYGCLNKTVRVITPIDMPTWMGKSHGAPLLDEDQQAMNNCWEVITSGISSLTAYPIVLKHIHTSNIKGIQCDIFIYIHIHILCIYN